MTRPSRRIPHVDGLCESGFIEGGNIIIERRFGEGRLDRYADLVAELVQVGVDAIITSANEATLGPPVPARYGANRRSAVFPPGRASEAINPEASISSAMPTMLCVRASASRQSRQSWPQRRSSITGRPASRRLLQALPAGQDASSGRFHRISRQSSRTWSRE